MADFEVVVGSFCVVQFISPPDEAEAFAVDVSLCVCVCVCACVHVCVRVCVHMYILYVHVMIQCTHKYVYSLVQAMSVSEVCGHVVCPSVCT